MAEQNPNVVSADSTAAKLPDGVVDLLDYRYWKANFGMLIGLGGGAAAARIAVPEPGGLPMLLLWGGSVYLHGLRSRQRMLDLIRIGVEA